MLLAAGPAPAAAQDVHVRSDTALVAYEVRSPGTAAFMTRRRLIQTLGFTYAQAFGARHHDGRPRPRLVASFDLRLDQDFGDTCLVGRDLCVHATSTGDLGSYQPLAHDTSADAPTAWLELRDLPGGARFRLGRQLLINPIGFVRLDGLDARIAPVAWLAAEAYAGALVRQTSLAGSDAFVPQGALHLALPASVDPSTAPYVSPPVTTWVAGAAVEGGDSRGVRTRLDFRELWESSGTVARRAAITAASAPWDALRLQASGVWDLLDGTLLDAVASVTVAAGPVTWRGGVDRHVPRFDAGTNLGVLRRGSSR